MPYIKEPRKIGVGVSFDEVTLRRIDALGGGEARTRSAFVMDMVEVGLETRFGPEWRTIADARVETQEPAA